jgi:RND superfamily putative drug exporter
MITAAALIMICVFMAFVFGGQRVIAEFGVSLAVAAAINAFVLRTVLVPALMHLLGPANWWLPGWLDRILPHLSVEGHPRSRLSPASEDGALAGQAVQLRPTEPVEPAAAPLASTGQALEPMVRPQSPPQTPHSGKVARCAPKSAGVAYLWWFFFGLFGVQYLYLGKTGLGLLYLCAAGLGGLGWLVDPFTLPRQVRRANAQIPRGSHRRGDTVVSTTTGQIHPS